MFNRTGAAVCAAAIAGVLLVPVPLSARGGAGAGHAGAGHHGGFRPIVRPHRHVHPPFVHPHRPPFAHRDIRREHDFHAVARRHHRGILTLPLFGYGVPVTYDDDSAFVGTYYDPSDFIRTIVVPAYAPPAPIPPFAGLPDPPPERAACRSEAVAVPMPDGAERSVTITRC